MNTDHVTAQAPSSLFAPLASMQEPDDTRMAKRANSYLAFVRSFHVANREDYSLAVEELGTIKTTWARAEAERVSFTGPLNQVLDRINAKFQPHLKTLKAAETLIKGKLTAFDEEEERRAAAVARENARQAQIERDRLAAEVRASEQAAQAERDRIQQELFDKMQAAAAEQAHLQAQAAAAEAAGDAAAAAAVAAEAQALQERTAAAQAEAERAADHVDQAAAHEVAAIEQMQAVIVAAPPQAPVKIAGLSTAKGWDYEVEPDDGMLRIVRFIAEHPQFIHLLVLDSIKTRALVKSLGPSTGIDGLRVFEKRSMRAATKVAA
jgi:hypothetical protein